MGYKNEGVEVSMSYNLYLPNPQSKIQETLPDRVRDHDSNGFSSVPIGLLVFLSPNY